MNDGKKAGSRAPGCGSEKIASAPPKNIGPRREILEQYNVEFNVSPVTGERRTFNLSPLGVITSDGEFQGCALCVPYFWKRAQERDNVEVDTDGDIVYFRVTEITAAERAEFPELGECSFIEMYRKSDGKVFAWIEL